MPPATTITATMTTEPEPPLPITPPSTVRSLHRVGGRGGGGGSSSSSSSSSGGPARPRPHNNNSNNNKDISAAAARRKLSFAAPPGAGASPSPSPSPPSDGRRRPQRRGQQQQSQQQQQQQQSQQQQSPLPAVMRVSDCRPGTPRFIGGLEEAALCLVFLLLCAPVTWSFALDFVFLGLGRRDLHIGIWSFFIVYWVLLALGLIPHFRKPVRWLLDSWFLKVTWVLFVCKLVCSVWDLGGVKSVGPDLLQLLPL
jgi:hypothetical protein